MFSNVTLLFFVLLIPLAGFIAWAGDYIGHRTGKRRHSCFGLRPRHTALVFTIAAGMSIALVSFGLFFIFSESFRVVLRDGEALYQNNRRLKQDNKRQAEELITAAERVNGLRQETIELARERSQAEEGRNEALASLKEAEAKRVEAVKRRTEAETKRTEAEDRAKEARHDYEQAKTRLAEAHSELRTARTSLSVAEKDLGDTRRDLKKENDRVTQALSRVTTAEAEVAEAGKRVATAKAEQQKAEGDARNARANAVKVERVAQEALKFQKEQLTALRTELDEQNKLYASLTGKTENQRQELDRMTLELERKRTEYNALVASTISVRRRQITYQVGEEVDRITIKGGLNVWRIQYMLDSFLTAAAKKAEARGAARGKEERALVIPPRMVADAGTSQGGGPQVMDEDDAVHATANTIRRANEDVLVVASVVANAVAGEPVAIDLRIHRNPVVLKKDARVGQIILNGEKSRQEIADAVYTFLSRDVHKNLIEAGMVPPSRGEEGTEEFSLTGEEWFKIMDDVRRAGPRPRLTVYAAKELRAGDIVSLRFEVRSTAPWGAPPPVDGSDRPNERK